jgi:hypothetical protein
MDGDCYPSWKQITHGHGGCVFVKEGRLCTAVFSLFISALEILPFWVERIPTSNIPHIFLLSATLFLAVVRQPKIH